MNGSDPFRANPATRVSPFLRWPPCPTSIQYDLCTTVLDFDKVQLEMKKKWLATFPKVGTQLKFWHPCLHFYENQHWKGLPDNPHVLMLQAFVVFNFAFSYRLSIPPCFLWFVWVLHLRIPFSLNVSGEKLQNTQAQSWQMFSKKIFWRTLYQTQYWRVEIPFSYDKEGRLHACHKDTEIATQESRLSGTHGTCA